MEETGRATFKGIDLFVKIGHTYFCINFLLILCECHIMHRTPTHFPVYSYPPFSLAKIYTDKNQNQQQHHHHLQQEQRQNPKA